MEARNSKSMWKNLDLFYTEYLFVDKTKDEPRRKLRIIFKGINGLLDEITDVVYYL